MAFAWIDLIISVIGRSEASSPTGLFLALDSTAWRTQVYTTATHDYIHRTSHHDMLWAAGTDRCNLVYHSSLPGTACGVLTAGSFMPRASPHLTTFRTLPKNSAISAPNN
jgi:hypothetical protein